MLEIPSTDPLVFVSHWEYECCGDLITVGRVHDLTVTAQNDDMWEPVGERRVKLLAQHHTPADPMAHIRARIKNLWEAHEQYDRSGPTLRRVPGSAMLIPIQIMDRDSDRNVRPGLERAGWLLDVTILETLPPRPDGLPYGMSSRRQAR